MRLFKCEGCGEVLHFENTSCVACGRRLGFLAEPATLAALEPEGEAWRALGHEGLWRFCANAGEHGCNWLVGDGEAFCIPCRHNHMIPDLSVPQNRAEWRVLEIAKRRLFYTLIRLGLPRETRAENPEFGLAFDFLAETRATPHVLTGHDNGLITIALKEADDAERARMRERMGEVYRTPLGHFRHEIGHYYWDRLVGGWPVIEDFRAMFGDERADYEAALAAHYATPPAPDWPNEFVSAYASSHPWEDFAETFAHFLHMIDTLEMAQSCGVSLHSQARADDVLSATIDFDPYRAPDIETLIHAWLPLTFVVNGLNRAMGQPDLYPFVLSPRAIQKLGFVRGLIAPLVPAESGAGVLEPA